VEQPIANIRNSLRTYASELEVKQAQTKKPSPFSHFARVKDQVILYTARPHPVKVYVYSSLSDQIRNNPREQLKVVMVPQEKRFVKTFLMLDEHFFEQAYKTFHDIDASATRNTFTGICARSPKYGVSLRFKLTRLYGGRHLMEMESVDDDHMYTVGTEFTYDTLRGWLHGKTLNVQFAFAISGLYLLKPKNSPTFLGLTTRISHMRLVETAKREMFGFPFSQAIGAPWNAERSDAGDSDSASTSSGSSFAGGFGAKRSEATDATRMTVEQAKRPRRFHEDALEKLVKETLLEASGMDTGMNMPMFQEY
jgi:hypothetical protein